MQYLCISQQPDGFKTFIVNVRSMHCQQPDDSDLLKGHGQTSHGGLTNWDTVGINVDAYLFLAFSDLTCHLEDTRIVRCAT